MKIEDARPTLPIVVLVAFAAWSCSSESNHSTKNDDSDTAEGSGGSDKKDKQEGSGDAGGGSLNLGGGSAMTGPAPKPIRYVPVEGDCGLDDPAFCDGFESGPNEGGASGELNAENWRSMRAMPSLHPLLDEAFVVGPSWIGDCRADLTNTAVLPSQDALICDPTDSISTRHLLTANAAQNYGLSSYRIRQPFDFEGREGRIVFDVDLSSDLLGGWPALVISQDPTPAPSFNYPERGSGPRFGIGIEFYGGYCNGRTTMMPQVFLFDNYTETIFHEEFECDTPYVNTTLGALNHVELRISEDHLEIWASDPSEDGLEFPSFQRLYAAEIPLSFSRAYLSLVVRNHATLKYRMGGSWPVRWDNVAFDGPVVGKVREYSSSEPLEIRTWSNGCLVEEECIWRGQATSESRKDESVCATECEFEVVGQNVGYLLPKDDEDPVSIKFPDVKLEDASRARLSIAVDYPWFEWDIFPPPTALKLEYRVNGAKWHERAISSDEERAFEGPPDEGPGAGLLNQMIDLDLSELKDGDNVIEMRTLGTWTGSYRAAATAADLILELH